MNNKTMPKYEVDSETGVSNYDFIERCAWCKSVLNCKDVSRLTVQWGNDIILDEPYICKSCRNEIVRLIEDKRNDIIADNEDYY